MAQPLVDVKITGADGVQKVFTNLPRSTAKKCHMQALRAGGKVVKRNAVKRLKAQVSPESTGVLEKGLTVYSLKKIRGQYRVGVAVKRGLVNQQKLIRGEPVRVGLYASVLEFRDGGKFAYMRPAAKESVNEVLNVMTSEISRRLNSAVEDAKR